MIDTRPTGLHSVANTPHVTTASERIQLFNFCRLCETCLTIPCRVVPRYRGPTPYTYLCETFKDHDLTFCQSSLHRPSVGQRFRHQGKCHDADIQSFYMSIYKHKSRGKWQNPDQNCTLVAYDSRGVCWVYTLHGHCKPHVNLMWLARLG